MAVLATFLIVATALVAYTAARPQTALGAAPAPFDVTFVASDKAYDGNADATIVSCAIVGDAYGATCAPMVGQTATFATVDVDTDIDVSADATDFDIVPPEGAESPGLWIVDEAAPTTADITARDLTVTATGIDKTYDGTADADVTLSDDGVSGDDIGAGYASASFDDKHVGAAQPISVTGITITGADADNYDLQNTTAATAATISTRDLTISAVTDSKTYDGTTDSSVEPAVTGLQTGDDVTGEIQAFDSRNASTVDGRTLSVTPGFTVDDGNGGLNYDVDATGTATGTIDPAPITVTATSNVKTADGTTSAAALPSYSPPLFTPDTPGFTESYATSNAGSGKTLNPAGKVNDGNNGDNYSYTYVPQNVGQIRPAPAASLTFTAQPIDTKTGTPIYNTCVPSGGAAPCALAGGAGSTPVQVTAKDTYGNLAGPGAPGADGTTAAIDVQIRRDTSSGTILGPSQPTNNGVAAFADQLVIAPTGPNNKLHAGTTAGSSPTTLSSQFAVVTDLSACDGQQCQNNGNNSGGSKLQKVAGQIKTSTDFYVAGTTNVLLSTRFTPGADTNQTPGACGTGATIGDSTDVQVTGVNVSGTAPASAIVLVMPKDTLKTLGITSRGTDSFNVCLGALKVAAGPSTWTAKKPNSKKVQLVSSQSGPESRQWGVPADCGTAGLTAADPCVALRTKQAATARTYLQGIGWTNAEINAIGLKDADFTMIVRKGSPWDGKFGMK